MIARTNRQRELVGWSLSVIVHVCLLTLGAVWLFQPVRFQVDPGETSTEIDLVAAPTPKAVTVTPAKNPVPAPPQPTPVTPPMPQAEPAKLTLDLVANIQPASKPALLSPPTPAPIAPARTRSEKSPAKSKPDSAAEASNASKGAIRAQPDELHNIPPVYPEESRIAHEQGTVIVHVDVTAGGNPSRVEILRSSGYFRLDDAARRAIQHWRFRPALFAGIPVASQVEIPVRFNLSD